MDMDKLMEIGLRRGQDGTGWRRGKGEKVETA